RVHALLAKKREPKPENLRAPSGNINGRWEVNVQFFSSAGKHKFFIEQDGNWLQGIHQSDFSMQDLVGIIEGDEVKIRSVNRRPGDSILYLFTGNISGDEITGSLFMGEYLTAEFKAKRESRHPRRENILVPGGPPLAT